MGYFGSDNSATFDSDIFPKKGSSEAEVLAGLDLFGERDVENSHAHSIVYATQLMSNAAAARVAKLANAKFVEKNMLFKELMKGTERMTLEVKRMITEMLGYPEGVRVRLTSGGSESLYCGINAAYQWAKVERRRIKKPEIVVPHSIHAAVTKWCHFTGIKLKRIPLGPDYRADVRAMERAITRNTILIAGSAPCWPFGLYDDIEALGAVAEKHDIWMHTDACMGGFLAPFAEKAGAVIPPWDFRVPGVRSISADLHKYGFSCKPLSSVTFRNAEYEQYHVCTPADWPDGPYATEALCGSSSAGPIASAWAVMKFLGEEGYVKLAKRALEVKERYTNAINAIDGVRCWESDLTPLVFEVENGLDMFAVLGGLFEREAYCLPGFQPPLIKVAIDPISDEAIDRFVDALRDVVAQVRRGETTIESIKPYL